MKKTTSKILLLFLATVFTFGAFLPQNFANASGIVTSVDINPFEDITPTDYYYDAVIWACQEGITTGTTPTKFAPTTTCTRGQVVTFLWRAMGEPEPKTTENTFSDVIVSDYYYKAVLWAVEEGITNGTGGNCFSPLSTCTNAHILTFIWRAMGEPEKTGNGDWYTDSVNWAKNGGLLDGTYTGAFAPAGQCPRANVVTYLYRYLSATVLSVFVSPDGNDATADGSAVHPFRTIDAARKHLRSIHKAKYTSIRVRIASGHYPLSEAITFTKDDSGTSSCPITYIGEEGTVLTGGISFDATAFEAASGDTMQYFPENVRDNLVMTDLKKLGVVAEEENLRNMAQITRSKGWAPVALNGKNLTLARYPNEDFAKVGAGSVVNCEGGAAEAVDLVTTTTIYFDPVHMEHVKSWHDLEHTYTFARYRYLWVDDNTSVLSIDEDSSSMTVLFAGGYDPKEGMPFYWYNVPEELDMPGEYYIDENAVLYYYPTAEANNGTFAMSILNDNLITLQDVDYLTFSNMTLEATRQSAIQGTANNLTVKNCAIRICSNKGIDVTGDNLLISSNEVSNIGNTAISVAGGDEKTLTRSNNIIYNNNIHDWSQGIGTMQYAVSISGCGTTVSHNDCVNSVDMAISYAGPYHTIEYNYCADTCQFFGDGGVVGSGDSFVYGTVVCYNYIKNGGTIRDEEIDGIGVQGITVDCGQSGLTAYGNVIENVTGSGFGICGGRDHNIYGNLIISCKYGLFYDSRYYAEIVRNGYGNRVSADKWQFSNSAWKAAFPILAKISFYDGENFDAVKDDKNFNAAPVSIIKDNVYYYDKAAHKPGADPYSIENFVYDFAELEIPDEENGKLYRYSSKRTALNTMDAIKENEDVIAITYEQFESIGRVN